VLQIRKRALLRSPRHHFGSTNMSHGNQFSLLKERRFLPFFVTQSLNAFNDNVFKQALIALITFGALGLNSDQQKVFTQAAAGLFILPFFLFSGISGQLSDKLDKAKIAVWVKAAEIGIMALGAVGFFTHNLYLLLAMLFMMGVHSTVFGPLKYGILPQVLKPSELTGGNGLVEMATFLAILIGTIVGTNLVLRESATVPHLGAILIAVVSIGLAIIGWFTARAIPSVPSAEPSLKVDWNPITSTWTNLQDLRGNRTVLLSCLGISWFWFFGTIYFTQLASYAKETLGGQEGAYTLLLAVFSVGTGIGSVLCEVLSKKRLEIGLVPFGAFGMTVFGVGLYFSCPEALGTHQLTVQQFIAQPQVWKVMVWMLLMAISSGLFIVPLFALVQSRSPVAKRSRIIAANNILNAAFMVVASLLAATLVLMKFSVPQILLITAVLNLLVAIYIFTLVPEFMMRFCCWILINVTYRVKVEGLENLPEEGPALIVCNHVGFTDPLLIAGSIPRPTVFVMYWKIYEVPGAKWLFKTARAIPIAGRNENPTMYEQAFAAISKALKEGEVVCIFPEGGLTPDGEIKEFKRGVELALERDPVPVLPMALQGLWGSMFSRWDRHNKKLKLPRRFFARVALVIGKLVPPEQANAVMLEAEVRRLRGDQA
jgi:1-acyl-sn-glycerol-3-phosphate acyltransferase